MKKVTKYVVYSDVNGFVKLLDVSDPDVIKFELVKEMDEASRYDTIGEAMRHAVYIGTHTNFGKKNKDDFFKVFPIYEQA